MFHRGGSGAGVRLILSKSLLTKSSLRLMSTDCTRVLARRMRTLLNKREDVSLLITPLWGCTNLKAVKTKTQLTLPHSGCHGIIPCLTSPWDRDNKAIPACL